MALPREQRQFVGLLFNSPGMTKLNFDVPDWGSSFLSTQNRFYFLCQHNFLILYDHPQTDVEAIPMRPALILCPGWYFSHWYLVFEVTSRIQQSLHTQCWAAASMDSARLFFTPETVLLSAVVSGLMVGLYCTGSNIRLPGIYVAFNQGKQKYMETSFCTLGPVKR